MFDAVEFWFTLNVYLGSVAALILPILISEVALTWKLLTKSSSPELIGAWK